MNWSNRLRQGGACAALAMFTAVGWSGQSLAQTELKVGYMKHPIHEASVAMMEKWAEANDVELIKIPMAYDIFQEKVTATLTSGGDQFDVIWHNDDWGQLWEKWVEPTDDIPGMDKVAKHPLDAFINDDGKVTVVPMAHTVGTFFYRTDLLEEDEVPTTFEELVEVSKRLQEEGEVKWGYVGGMKMNHTWFSFWWTMWSNDCDIFLPIHERDNAVLEENGWQPAIAEPCQQEIVEFWWDALHEDKISPPGMTSYGRDEANAIFMAGDAAFTLVDSTHYGDFNDPNKSRVAGNVGMAKFPVGPQGDAAGRLERDLGLGDPPGHARGAQAGRQGDAGRHAERHRRPGAAVGGDRRAAAQHGGLGRHRRAGPGVRQAQGGGVRGPYPDALGLLLPELAGGAQGLLGRGDRGGHRHARGHPGGPQGRRADRARRRGRQLTRQPGIAI